MRLADVEFERTEQGVVARVSGEVDLSNAESIGAALVESMPNDEHRLILDLSGVDYLDSAGIQLIYQLRERLRARGQTLALVIPPSSPSHDALRLAGLSPHVEMAENVEQARGNDAP
jgi:anti-sigma B factor antagonist